MNGENRLAEKQYTAQDIEGIIYQQAVMKKVQAKIEVFIRYRVSRMCNFNLVNRFSSLNCAFWAELLLIVLKWKTDFNLIGHIGDP